jgi:hypothetical protein
LLYFIDVLSNPSIKTCTVTATGNSNRRVTGEEVEEDVEDIIEEDDGRPRLKVLFQPTVGQ